MAPNFRALAPKARADVNKVAAAIRESDNPEALLADINDGGADVLGVLVEPTDVEVKRVERHGSLRKPLKPKARNSSTRSASSST